MALNDANEEICLLPGKANRHGLIAGATGTGKTVTLRVMAEAFSEMGVPVFLADVKGDLAGMMAPGIDSEDMQARIERFNLKENGFFYQGYPVTFWDIYGQNGIQLRTTISEMGPLLLSRIMKLNELQTNILSIVFKIADDNGLLLIDTKDLKAMLNHVNSNHKEYEAQYGKMSPASIAAILRAVVALEIDGGEVFFGEPGLNIYDLLTTEGGKGMINILDSESLINNGRLYSTFLLWLLSELFEMLPEVGDPEKPRMVFFFDEAHLLFNDAPKTLLEKIEQVVKLVRSKGVGVYFCTQNPKDVPDGVLAQLGNKIQHALHAYTPAERKAVRSDRQPSTASTRKPEIRNPLMRSWRDLALRRKKLSAEPRKRLRKRREGPRKRRKRPREKKKRRPRLPSREKRKSARRRERRRKPLRPRSAPPNLSEALSQAQSAVKSARLSEARSAEPSERLWAETLAPALEEASSILCSGNKGQSVLSAE